MESQRHIDILASSDNNYVMPLAALITSIIRTKNKNTEITFYIVEDNIEEYNKQKLNGLNNQDIEIIFIAKPDLSDLKVSEDIISTSYISIAMYYRLYSARILPQDVHKILYLDCDMIVCNDLWDLYSTDFEDNYVVGVRDLFEKECCERLQLQQYINSGMMLINLDKWREDNLTDLFEKTSISNTKQIKWPDQDILNMTCSGKIKLTESLWNVQVGTDLAHEDQNILARNARIIHYITDKKPWIIGVLHPYYDEFQKNLAFSPFKEMQFKKIHVYLNNLVTKPLFKDIFYGALPEHSSRKKLFFRTVNRLIEYMMKTNYSPLK